MDAEKGGQIVNVIDEMMWKEIDKDENREQKAKGKIIASDSPNSKSFIRLYEDKIELVVDGISGIVITSDGVTMQGMVQQNAFPLDKKTMGFFAECPTHLLFVPPSMVTPQPVMFPANPLTYVVRLAKKLAPA